MDDGGYHEGYYSLLDEQPTVRLTRHASEARLLDDVQDDWAVQRLAWFSKGFYGVSRRRARRGSRMDPRARWARCSDWSIRRRPPTACLQGGVTPIVMTDLRMGQTPWFVFAFVVAERDDDGVTRGADPAGADAAPARGRAAEALAAHLGRGRSPVAAAERITQLR